MMLQRFFTVTAGLLAGLAVIVAGLMLIAVVITYPRLPSLDVLTDYRPKMPLRVYSADNVLIGEFGEERRSFTRIQDVPQHMKQALLAAEDERFYQHGGIDYLGVLRARWQKISSCPVSALSHENSMRRCWHSRLSILYRKTKS